MAQDTGRVAVISMMLSNFFQVVGWGRHSGYCLKDAWNEKMGLFDPVEWDTALPCPQSNDSCKVKGSYLVSGHTFSRVVRTTRWKGGRGSGNFDWFRVPSSSLLSSSPHDVLPSHVKQNYRWEKQFLIKSTSQHWPSFIWSSIIQNFFLIGWINSLFRFPVNNWMENSKTWQYVCARVPLHTVTESVQRQSLSARFFFLSPLLHSTPPRSSQHKQLDYSHPSPWQDQPTHPKTKTYVNSVLSMLIYDSMFPASHNKKWTRLALNFEYCRLISMWFIINYIFLNIWHFSGHLLNLPSPNL